MECKFNKSTLNYKGEWKEVNTPKGIEFAKAWRTLTCKHKADQAQLDALQSILGHDKTVEVVH